jgi:DNA-3-methyladenine glycosylase II
MSTTDTQSELNQALGKAAELDSDLALIISQIGYPAPRERENSFATLMQIIVSQQLSTKAAAAIWGRVATLFPAKVNAGEVLELDDQVLRDCGLSWRKVEYAKALATQIKTKELVLDHLATQDIETIVTNLVKIKGFGRWSAEIYAIFALGHPDVFPAADLALQIAAGKIKGFTGRPTEKQTREIAAQWSPHQSAVSLLLWHYYGSTTLD